MNARQKDDAFKREKSRTLKLLLYSTAFKMHVKPTYTYIWSIFKPLVEQHDAGLTEDNIHSWLKGHFPSETKEEKCLLILNCILFEGMNVIRNLAMDWNSIQIERDIKSRAERLLNEKVIEKKLQAKNVLISPDYQWLDPMALTKYIMNSNDVLRAHMLYHSPVAAEIWDRITKDDVNYPLYRKCANGLRELLNKDKWKDELLPSIRSFFVYGAGSASKDRIILSWIKNSPNDVIFTWVDASSSMLWKTIKNIDTESYKNVSFTAIAADFEHPQRVIRLFNDSLSAPSAFEERKAFFILGFTLSNLDERRFFTTYKEICTKGDLFVFPMQFIPKDAVQGTDELHTFKESLLKTYDFDEGNKLAQAWFTLLEGYEKPKFIEPKIEPMMFINGKSLCVEFEAILNGPSYINQRIITARSSRHYKQDYFDFLNSEGYEVKDEVEVPGGVTTLLVEFIGS